MIRIKIREWTRSQSTQRSEQVNCPRGVKEGSKEPVSFEWYWEMEKKSLGIYTSIRGSNVQWLRIVNGYYEFYDYSSRTRVWDI